MLKKLFYTILITFFLFQNSETQCIASIVASREPVIEINRIEGKIDINSSLLLYKDRSKKLGIDDVQKKFFLPNNKSNINLGYNNDADWIKFNVSNTRDSAQNIILTIDKILIDSLCLYFYNHNLQQWDSVLVGAGIPKRQKPMLGLNTSFPLHLPPNKISTFYLRCTSSYGKDFSISLITIEKTHVKNMLLTINYGIFIGWFLSITLFNLFIGFSIKDKLYLHYALANIFTLLGGLANMGFYAHFLPDNLTDAIPYATSISFGLFVVFASNFNIRILELKKYSIFSFYLMTGLAYLELLVIIVLNVMRYIGKPHHYALITLFALLFSIAALLSGIIAQRKGSRYARFYITAWSLMLLGIAMLTLTLMGYIPTNIVTGKFYEIGASLEIILLSFALADRYNYMQKEKNKLELELQYKTNDLSKVVTDNRMRHSFKVKILEELKSIYQNKSGSAIQDLGSFITDLNIQIDAEDKRNQLQENIDKINTEFERKLKGRFPKLTKSEIEICGYLKLNLSTKEIASLRNTSENSVKVNKHRIIKKLLEEGSSLDELLYEL